MLVPSATVHHEMMRLQNRVTAGRAVFHTNSLGLRGPEPVRKRPAGILRILVLGDETILGPELPDAHTLPARLADFLTTGAGRQVEVVNAGVPGYCPLLSWLQFRHDLEQLSPDIVILHFDMTDVADDAVYRRLLRESGQHNICVNPNVSGGGRPQNSLLRSLQESALLELLKSKAGFHAASDAQNMLQRFEWTADSRTDLRLQIQHALSPIARFADAAEEDGYLLLVSTSPVPWQVGTAEQFPLLSAGIKVSSEWPAARDVPQQILQAACEQCAVHLCDATAAFRSFSRPERLFGEDSADLSAYGSALYAREIAAALLQTEEYATLLRQPGSLSVLPQQQN